ncbi:transcriptional regulator [Shewanella algicola]|uniref:GyrI-like domain-containing protein n=1 Tax=Shewanella algicola TaxID=640633 RepID=A0A9X1Z2M4_9GAMM|nr:GyrI-like domain-containing protein [Shewanella algicola]MCL1104371.1 GyrI-like domain-containing protein [Shewanella algicola]GGP42561.1 transcriptional regulator [Shewanella algicola]
MNIVNLDNMDVKGISIRTDNLSEMSPSTAKIGALWQQFYEQLAASLTQGSNVFGLYTHYESDHMGSFDVVACSDKLTVGDLASFQIQSGEYLVFKGTGEMPQAIIDLWGEVWEYFDNDTCQLTRAYTTDFEHYINENEVELFISVKHA